eukprot:2031139-Pleurochrysis_carterae.AAC.4
MQGRLPSVDDEFSSLLLTQLKWLFAPMMVTFTPTVASTEQNLLWRHWARAILQGSELRSRFEGPLQDARWLASAGSLRSPTQTLALCDEAGVSDGAALCLCCSVRLDTLFNPSSQGEALASRLPKPPPMHGLLML